MLDIKYNWIELIVHDTYNLFNYKITFYTFGLFKLFKQVLLNTFYAEMRVYRLKVISFSLFYPAEILININSCQRDRVHSITTHGVRPIVIYIAGVPGERKNDGVKEKVSGRKKKEKPKMIHNDKSPTFLPTPRLMTVWDISNPVHRS